MTAVRRVEITEPGGVKLGARHYQGPTTDPDTGETIPGDIATRPKQDADLVIGQGWGRDPITGEQGERVEGAVALEVDDSESAASAADA